MIHASPSSQCPLQNCHQYKSTVLWKPLLSLCPVSAVELPASSTSEKLIYSSKRTGNCLPSARHALVSNAAKAARSHDPDYSLGEFTSYGDMDGKASKGSGTTARGRRLLKIREEKRKREYDRLHNYPTWAKVLEDACQNDEELRAVLGDSVGNPELMRKRVEERVRKRGRDFNKSKAGSVLAFKVSFRDFNPIDSYIWFELYGSPSDRDVELLGGVIQSWYVMGRLGAYNSSNLQLAGSSVEDNPLYDEVKGSTAMPSSFHDISSVEFQDNWGRVWVDLGTSDFFAIDVLLNCLTALSSEYMGIQQVVFGGRTMGDWEEGMTSPDDGYKSFKI